MPDDANQRPEERSLAGTPQLEVRKKTPLMSAELGLIHPASRRGSCGEEGRKITLARPQKC